MIEAWTLILVVDNDDSFTFNLDQALHAAGADIRVVRQPPTAPAWRRWPTTRPPTSAVTTISPGPGDPDDAGVSVGVIDLPGAREDPRARRVPRHESMAVAFGGTRSRAPTLVHGEASEVPRDGAGLAGMPPAFMAARYHSLAVDPATLPPELRITAMSEVDRVVMAPPPRCPAEGVQFDPESVRTRRDRPAPETSCGSPGEGGPRGLDASGSCATAGMAEPTAAPGDALEPDR